MLRRRAPRGNVYLYVHVGFDHQIGPFISMILSHMYITFVIRLRNETSAGTPGPGSLST